MLYLFRPHIKPQVKCVSYYNTHRVRYYSSTPCQPSSQNRQTITIKRLKIASSNGAEDPFAGRFFHLFHTKTNRHRRKKSKVVCAFTVDAVEMF